MKKLPHEAGDYGLDPKLNFSQFLEEARERVKGISECPQNPDEAGRKQSCEAKKNRKSWKTSLFSWWKASKKSNSDMAHPSVSHQSKPRRVPVSTSGPIHRSDEGGAGGNKYRRTTSGPLTSLFLATKRIENETPYECLEKPNGPSSVQSYGPIYLVT
ncbi:hypothetical protein U1Q18_026769 [Sarracenia purpurea var. burkii]